MRAFSADFGSRRSDGLIAVAIVLGVAAVFALGCSRTIYVGDSGELVTAVYLLGTPHPTGYPLYIILGKLWTLLIPLGSIAYRMSLFSTACAALATGGVFLFCRRLGLARIASATASLLLAFSPSFWSQANIQRVYSLNALFVVLATAAAFRWHTERDQRSLVLAFFLGGLGTTNHSVMAIYTGAFACFVLLSEPAILRRWRVLAAAGAAYALGLIPYVYLPLASRADPRLDWGNPETLEGFLNVVLRRGYWQRAWLEQPSDFLVVATDFLLSLGAELLWPGIALAALGLWAGWRRGWPVLLAPCVVVGNVLIMGLHGSRTDVFVWHRYYIPSYIMFVYLAAMGTHVLAERLPRRLRLLPLLLPLFLLVSGWKTFDRSHYSIGQDFSNMVLESVPPGGHLIASDDNILFVLMYLHLVEKQRPDINLILQGVGDTELPALRFDPDREPVLFTHHPNWNQPKLDIVPAGVLFRAVRAGRPRPEPAISATELEGENDPGVPKDYLTQNLIGHFHYMLGVTHEQSDWLRARGDFDAATQAAPLNDVLFYNLGLIYARNGLLDDALAAFRRSHAINPRGIVSTGRARASDRMQELDKEMRRIAALEGGLLNDTQLRALEPATPAHQRRLAELLAARGELVAARGHVLKAAELEAGLRK